jgi:hypothetical protein
VAWVAVATTPTVVVESQSVVLAVLAVVGNLRPSRCPTAAAAVTDVTTISAATNAIWYEEHRIPLQPIVAMLMTLIFEL